ncbi:MAG: ankyrin repeat domain-containing protein [Hahellaceae bacterium]|nr:ankyrin repeat domain-containing protein [Hahellaceae bacterium]
MKKPWMLLMLVLTGCATQPDIEEFKSAWHQNDMSVIAEQIDAGLPIDTSLDRERHTGLHLAVQAGNRAQILFLLAHHANPNVQDLNGQTPLHFAVQSQRVDLMNLLTTAGANPFVPDSLHQTPVSLAINSQQSALIEWALQQQLSKQV